MADIDTFMGELFLKEYARKRLSCNYEFAQRLFRGAGEPALTRKGNGGNTAWEFTLDSFSTYCLMASGAQWIRDAQGHWQLIETNGLEPESAVIELCQFLNLPIFVSLDFVKKIPVDTSNLASLLKFGLPLHVEGLEHAAQAEDGKSGATAGGQGEKKRNEAKDKNRATCGNSANVFCRLLHALKQYIKQF